MFFGDACDDTVESSFMQFALFNSQISVTVTVRLVDQSLLGKKYFVYVDELTLLLFGLVNLTK